MSYVMNIVRSFLDKEPAMFMGLTLGLVGCSLPFAVIPMRRMLGAHTYCWSDTGYSCSKKRDIINNAGKEE